MLNIIHRLKSGMLPGLFFLSSSSVLTQPLVISPGHRQEGMAVGVTEFSGTLYVPDVSWQWQPCSVRMSTPDAAQDFYILGWRTASLTTVRLDAFIPDGEALLSSGESQLSVAGAWGTSQSDVHVNFPGVEEPIKRWQGNLTPVVAYF